MQLAGSSRNLTELAFERSNVWFENLASRFLGKRSRVWARDGKSGRSLESKIISSTRTMMMMMIIIIIRTMRRTYFALKSQHWTRMSFTSLLACSGPGEKIIFRISSEMYKYGNDNNVKQIMKKLLI